MYLLYVAIYVPKYSTFIQPSHHVLVPSTAVSVFIPLPLNFIPKLKLKQILVGYNYHLYIREHMKWKT